MLLWVVGTPLFFFLLLFALSWLEAEVVAPSDRAAKIRELLEREDAERLEADVAAVLATVRFPRKLAAH